VPCLLLTRTFGFLCFLTFGFLCFLTFGFYLFDHFLSLAFSGCIGTLSSFCKKAKGKGEATQFSIVKDDSAKSEGEVALAGAAVDAVASGADKEAGRYSQKAFCD